MVLHFSYSYIKNKEFILPIRMHGHAIAKLYKEFQANGVEKRGKIACILYNSSY